MCKVTSDDVYARLERRFADWAAEQSVIQAVIVVGSRARSDHPADEWSDLDLVVFASDASSYLQDSTWLNTFGTVIAAITDSFGQRDQEWIAMYADGSKLDVAFLSIDPAAAPTVQAMLTAFPYPVVLQRGMRVLIDRTGSENGVRLRPIATPQPPTSLEFTALVNRMRLDATKTAKFIRRRDLWRAKQLCDGEMKQHLLTMLEWHAAAQTDQRDIWYDGRFLSEWADPQAMDKLPATFAAYEAADLQRALFATLDLFRRLAHEVAGKLDYAYRPQTDQFVDDHIRSMW